MGNVPRVSALTKVDEINPKIFGGTALAWLIVGYGLLRWSGETLPLAAWWHLGFWAIVMLNLIALAGAMKALLELASADLSTPAMVVRAFGWGTFKLACFGFLVVLLVQATAPSFAMLTGLATLPVVVLGGAFILSFRNRSNA